VLDADLVHQQLQDFEQLVKVLPMEEQKELFDLLLRQVRVYPFDPAKADQECDGRSTVARVQGRQYRVEIAIHQLPERGLECLPRGKSSENGKLGSPS